MPLNYSKWDALEVSDDSDIEGHPNVDHKSLVRWKQRDIHEKRQQRKQKIMQLEAELACNKIVLARLETAVKDTEAKGPGYFNELVERLQTNPSPEKPPSGVPSQPTYDALVLASLMRAFGALKDSGATPDDPKFKDKLVKALREHLDEFRQGDAQQQRDLEHEHEEQKKKITSDDIHEGFDSKYVPAKPAPPPLVQPKTTTKPTTKKEKAVEYEVLNPKASASTSAASNADDEADAEVDTEEEDEDDEEEQESLPDMTPELKEYAKIGLHDWEKLYKYLQDHRGIFVDGASDALLVEGFTAEQRGAAKYAAQCIHRSLTIQYSQRLGADGPRVFFTKMLSGDPRAKQVFMQDFESTYAHVKERAAIVRAEEEGIREKGGKETIQLVPQDENQSIQFNVPDGPPPEDLRLEGEGVEDLDINEVRQALQMRWDIFNGFPDPLKKALKSGKLDKINKVLGDMSVEEAEGVVESLQLGGILSFANEGKIHDVTAGDDPRVKPE